MNRFFFAFKHFLLSLTVFSLVGTVVIYFWYPMPYFTASGGGQGLKIAAMVDLVLGPLLTLVIANPNKKIKELVMDLTIIVFIQLSAFLFGMHTIYSQRPIANVYWELEKSFFVISAQDIENHGISIKEYDTFDNKYSPKLIIANLPRTEVEIRQFNENVSLKKLPPYLQTNLYSDLKHNFDNVKNTQVDLRDLMEDKRHAEQIYDNLISKYGGQSSDFTIVTSLAKYQVLGLIFDHDGNLLETIELGDYK